MKARLVCGVVSSCCVAGVLGAMTVDEFLAGRPLGKLVVEQAIPGSESVQKTPGRHEGHRVLAVDLPLVPAGKGSSGQYPYSLRYVACLERKAHPNAIELIAREGMCGIGVSRPSGANWYGGSCLDVVVNGKGLGAYRPVFRRCDYETGAVAVSATWPTAPGAVSLTFSYASEDGFFRVKGHTASPQRDSLEIRLRAFPSVTKRTGKRVGWTAGKTHDGTGKLVAGRADCWMLLGDTEFDPGNGGRGAGPCAVAYSPAEVRNASAILTDYSVDIRLSMRPGVDTFHLALWEFKELSNEQALARMRELGANLEVRLGASASGPVVVRDVPPRAVVVEGKPAASIVLRDGHAEREVEAALELQETISKSTGAVLPIVTGRANSQGHAICSDVRQPDPGESFEAFRITVAARETRIIGNSPLATLYGAYELLETAVGARWYLPGPLGEVIPKHTTLVLPELDVVRSPSFPMRWIGTGSWMVRNKQNRCDDGFLIAPGIYHTQNRLIPHREYFEKHPEFFALIKGKRSSDPLCKLCYSNPELQAEIARNMAALLDKNPNIKLISLSPTDGQMWCECEGCVAMDEVDVARDRSKSRRSLLFYNAVAGELRKTHPEARMLVGAYNVYNWPPLDKSVKADPMIDVIITHYEDYCLAHPVPDPACPLNQRYVELIKEWQEMGCAAYFYEYYWKVNWLDLPWPIVHSIREDMPWYKKEGCKGVYTQYNPEAVWGRFPAFYVAARLLWDVNADVDAMVDRMFDDLFGTAAPHMKACHNLLENQTAQCGRHFPGRGMTCGPAVFTPEIRAQLRIHYEAALEANADPLVAQRLEKMGLCLEYTDRLMEYVRMKQDARAEPDPDRASILAKDTLAHGTALVEEARRDRRKWSGVLSRSILSPRGYLGRDVERWRKEAARKKQILTKKLASLPTTWRFALDKDDEGQKQKWFGAGFDDSGWAKILIGRTWESQGYEYDGFAWYRLSYQVDPKLAPRPVSLYFGAVDGEAWVYWNGRLLGHHEGWDEPFSFRLEPGDIRTDVPNVIAVRVYDGSNAGGIYKLAYLIESK